MRLRATFGKQPHRCTAAESEQRGCARSRSVARRREAARAYGGVVTGGCGPGKADVARAAGAEHVLDHTRDAVTGRFDVVIDIGGNRTLRTLRRVLAPRGTLVVVGGETGGRIVGGVDRQLRAVLLSPLVSSG